MADSAKAEKGKRPQVPESLLKKRKASEERKARRAKAALLNRKRSRSKRKVMFQRAEKYIKEYRAKERTEIRLDGG